MKPQDQKIAIHHASDGLGARRVFLDGVEVRQVVVANCRRGYVDMACDPVRIAKDGESVATYRRHGYVTVEFM